jgi:ABC-type sugar transport system permease subunit
MLFAILITLLSLFYFLPFAIAFNRKRANTGAIFALNLFLGWSLIGWVVALVWALKEENVI